MIRKGLDDDRQRVVDYIDAAMKHRSAVKFLMGLGTNPDLSRAEQARLTDLLRGPFARGMTEYQAVIVLKNTIWRDDH